MNAETTYANPFTEANMKSLGDTCQKMADLTKESVNGDLMHSQLEFLGDLIEQFVKNPIVATSGLVDSAV